MSAASKAPTAPNSTAPPIPARDQSYFLFATTQAQLDFLRFPLGGMPKPRVRELAAELGLGVAAKPDSQDICFVPDGDYASLVKKLRPEAEAGGDIVDESGRKLGEHQRPDPLHRRPAPRARDRRQRPNRSMSSGSIPRRAEVVVGPKRALAVRAGADRATSTGSAAIMPGR